MPEVTKLPDSDDNAPTVKLIKALTHACWEHDGEMSIIEITGCLEVVKHQILFDSAIEEVDWEE